jgi:CRISPR-associated protein Cst2
MSTPLFELAILARATWNLHSLNNEGTVGNVSEPRTVVLADGRKSDAISGEMLKHVHAQNLWLITDDKSVFCESCRVLQPQRADKSNRLDAIAKKTKKDAAQILDAAIESCVMCDLHGFLRTAEAIPRSSTVEFGWAVALPDQFHRDHHIHARHVVEGRGVERTTESKEEEGGGASAQMVYHRPTRSGRYALVSVFQPWRIGLNEIIYRYAQVDRPSRFRSGIEAYKASFARTDGAMTSTRLPHAQSIEGLIVTSSRNFPVPTPSPLNDSYNTDVAEAQKALAGVESFPFDSLPKLLGILDNLAKRDPFTLMLSDNGKRD